MAEPIKPDQVEREIKLLHAVVDEFAVAMKQKLTYEVAEKGRTGWSDPANAQATYHSLLANAAGVPLAAGEEVDIANLAMFLRFQRITATSTGGQS